MGVLGKPWSDEQRQNFKETIRKKREVRLKAAGIQSDPETEEKHKKNLQNDRNYHRRRKLRNIERTNISAKVTSVAKYKVHCIRCGFPMEICTDALILSD